MAYSKTVVTNNVNIYVSSVNASLKSVGLAPLPDGTSVSKATQLLQQALSKMTATSFSHRFPNLTLEESDYGYVGPTNGLQAGSTPSCAVQQVKGYFDTNGYPYTETIVDSIVSTITQNLVSQGGVAGTYTGEQQVNSNESIAWVVGYAAVAISATESGYVYTFGAALDF